MSNHTARFYDTFRMFYPVVDLFLKSQKKVLFNLVNALPEGNLLEIGVGNGAHFKYYKKHQIIGIDTSEAMLDIALKRAVGNIRLHYMDGTALLFDDEQFDYIVLSHVIAVVDNPHQLLQEASRVLKPHGQVFILNHFTPDNLLKYIDRLLRPVARAFRFRSVFYVNDISQAEKITLLKEINIGPASYFKLLIYGKK